MVSPFTSSIAFGLREACRVSDDDSSQLQTRTCLPFHSPLLTDPVLAREGSLSGNLSEARSSCAASKWLVKSIALDTHPSSSAQRYMYQFCKERKKRKEKKKGVKLRPLLSLRQSPSARMFLLGVCNLRPRVPNISCKQSFLPATWERFKPSATLNDLGQLECLTAAIGCARLVQKIPREEFV
ncbi:hypothetical protein BKA81DRAFT_152772 [Phyllosticta paracitricarpa]